jgi:hypothetical protein
MLALITLFFLIVFSMIYLSKGMEKKPPFMVRALDAIDQRLSLLALSGCIYGFAATILTPMTVSGVIDIPVRLFANVVLTAMALPFAFDQLIQKYEEKINPAILEGIRDTVNNIARREKELGIAGAVAALLIFGLAFR